MDWLLYGQAEKLNRVQSEDGQYIQKHNSLTQCVKFCSLLHDGIYSMTVYCFFPYHNAHGLVLFVCGRCIFIFDN